jgi:hypothetical protein
MTREPHLTPSSAQILLSPEASIVLFELLSRWCDDNNASTPDASCFESTAEGAVLHMVLADLESQVVAPFEPDYGIALEKARCQLEDAWGMLTLRG